MSNVLITGINGFVGGHLTQIAKIAGLNVVGVGTQKSLRPDLADMVQHYYSVDLTNPMAVQDIDLTRADAIVNLAGYAKVGESRGKLEEYLRVNIGVHKTLYDECLRQKVTPRIIAISTGAVYDPGLPLPITEETPLISKEKTNEYVISKQLMEESLEPFRQRGLRIIVARPFNHSGPGQLPGFLLPDLIEQIKQSRSSNSALRVGNLKTRRDYTDVRDVAKAYLLLATEQESKIKHDLYNICSGKSTTGEDILDMLLNACDASNLEVVVDPAKLRKHEIMDIYGSFDRLRNDTGWSPNISVETMIKDFVAWKLNQD